MASDSSSRSKKFGRMARIAMVLALIVALAFGAGVITGAGANGRLIDSLPLFGDGLNSAPDTSVDLADFWKAWNVLNERFVDTSTSTLPSARDRLFGAIQGLADAYGDPYTIFLPPEEAKIFKEDIVGNFSGIGAEIGLDEDGVLTVIAPLKGTPAERAGLRAGDNILSIDGTASESMTPEEAIKLIRGDKGTTVTFRIWRDGQISEVSIVRDIIEVPTLDKGYDPATGVYTITLYSFTGSANRLFTQALSDFRSSGSTRLLIDLRGNPGGYLQSAVQIASRFLPKEEIIVTEDYDGKRDTVVHRSLGNGNLPEGTKIAILIDRGSASASEIVAGALRDHEVATLIGTRSFGKGSVQELIDIGGGTLKVTIAKWITPSGDSISDGGLTPDIEVEVTEEDIEAGLDPQRDRAVRFLTTGE